MSEETTRILYEQSNEDGTAIYKTNLPPESRTGTTALPYDPRRVIPIVLVPGIMGTRLKHKGKDRIVWDPPNTIGDMISTFFEHLFKGSTARAKEVDPERTEVAYEMPKNLTISKKDPQASQNRELKGWGALFAGGYHKLMEQLEAHLNILGASGALELPQYLQGSPTDYGADEGEPLTIDEYKTACGNYRFELWGCGYNWLKSNGESSEELNRRINDILNSYSKENLNNAKKVIIVSHSMGGLVTRSACAQGGSEKILGAVHIAQPAAGAPAVYKRMRVGFEGIEKVVLGRNAADVTGILGKAQGGLELLPFANYNGGQKWLSFPSSINDEWPETQWRPTGGDPYESIYKLGAWYDLVPDYHLKYILAGKKQTQEMLLDIRADFAKLITKVKLFHDSVATCYHDNTYAIWGEDPDRKSWGMICWRHDYTFKDSLDENDPRYFAYDYENSISDNGKGRIDQFPGRVVLADAADPGDGTVPDVSAQDQSKKAKIKFIHGKKNGAKNQHLCWDHADACNDERVIWATLYNVIKLVNETQP